MDFYIYTYDQETTFMSVDHHHLNYQVTEMLHCNKI